MKKIKLYELNKLTKNDFGGIVKIIPTQLLETLELIELPISKEKSIIKICDFLSYLNCMLVRRDVQESGKVVLPQTIWIKYFTKNEYKSFKEILKNNNIITQVSYDSGIGYDMNNGIAKQYRIRTEYLQNDDFTILLFDNKKTKKDIKIETNVTINYLNTICNEELDYDKVFKDEYEYYKTKNKSLFSLYSRITRALLLNVNRYIKKGTKVNRIYHSFSNLSKVTRKCFKTFFNNIDLKNSQPILLVYYLVSNGIEFENEYQIICEEGKFYELFYDLYSEIEDQDELRKTVKVAVYESLFFAFNKNRRINKRFKELFPLTWKALKELNDKGITLASILQNIEAEIFNNIDVKYSKKYFTLFDAIYFNDKRDINYIVKQIEKEGNKYNINFSLSINN